MLRTVLTVCLPTFSKVYSIFKLKVRLSEVLSIRLDLCIKISDEGMTDFSGSQMKLLPPVCW